MINNLPQVLATQNSGVSNGADGTATVSLRGLGTSRTLVLIDGRRLMPGGIGGGAAADLNFIPAALISNVEILTGGASSTYGADAVAGVVNFKMNRKFEGVSLDAQYSIYQHNNNNSISDVVNRRFTSPTGNNVTGGSLDTSLVIGGAVGEGGHIVAYAGYRRDTAITQDSRDFSICTLNPDAANVGFACGGSGTPAAARFGGFTPANLALAGLSESSFTLTPSNGLIPYVGLRDGYNFAPLNYYRRPSDRYTAGVFAEYEINENFTPYLDVMFMDYSTKAQIAPSGAFYGVRQVNCDNPLLSANLVLGRATCGAALGTATNSTILIGKRNIEGGPRFNEIGFNQFRVVTGTKGEISSKWNYDVSAQFGQIKLANTYRNDVSDTRIDRALQVVNVGGVPTCRSVIDGSDPSCVPYNVFTTGGITSAAANYIGIPLVLTGTSKETIVQANITGDLGFASPLAGENIKTAFGAEYRKEQLSTQPDLSFINGDGAGQGGPTLPITGSYTVRDLYAEAVVPLIQDKPFFKDLSIELGFRNSSYKVSGNPGTNSENTWKVGLNWNAADFVKFRGSINRAVRSPNIGELFSNSSIGLFAGSDPCAGPAVDGLVNGNTAAACARTGVTDPQFGNLTPNTSASQYNGFFGGNLALNPEKSDSWTAGFVLTPIGSMSLSVDYYNIKVKNAIGTVGAQVTLNQCLASGDPIFCSNIRRAPALAGPAAGSLWLNESGYVDDRTTNTGSLKTSGVDVNFDYRVPVGSNKITLSLIGTYVDKFISQPITNGFDYDCAGFYGITCGQPLPKWRHTARIKFTTDNDVGITATWRYAGAVKVDTISADTDLQSIGASPTIDERLKAENYFDLLFSARIQDKFGLRLGINNILDNDPPVVSQSSLGGFGNGNTFPGTYDYLGRYIFLGVSLDF